MGRKSDVKGGILLIIVGVIALILAIKTPRFITLFDGFGWKISVFFIGVFIVVVGVLNIFHKEK